MKIIWQALAGALALHLAYIGILFLIGWIQTFFYKPQFPSGSLVLQSEVSFGYVIDSPLVFVSSFIIVVILLVLILMERKQIKKMY